MAIADNPPRRSISSAASSSKYVTQSHITKRSPARDEQRALADREPGSGADAVSPESSRSSLACVRASSSSVVQRCPSSGTYWRSSVQIGQCAGGADASGNWAAQVAQT